MLFHGPLISWDLSSKILQYLGDERVSHSVGIFMVADTDSSQAVIPHEAVAHVLSLLHALARPDLGALSQDLGREADELLDRATLEEGEGAKVVAAF